MNEEIEAQEAAVTGPGSHSTGGQLSLWELRYAAFSWSHSSKVADTGSKARSDHLYGLMSLFGVVLFFYFVLFLFQTVLLNRDTS